MISDRKKPYAQTILQILFAVVFFGILLWIVLRFHKMGINGLAQHLRENYIWGVIIVLLLYVVKAFLFFLPVSVICIAVSLVFHPMVALCLNFAGYTLEIAAGYFAGKIWDKETIIKKLSKNQAFQTILGKLGNSNIITIILLRFIPFFPNDIMSAFFGITKIQFQRYFLGSILGCLPWIIGYTLAGSAIQTPVTARFIIPVVLLLLGIFAAAFYYWKLNGKSHTERKEEDVDERS